MYDELYEKIIWKDMKKLEICSNKKSIWMWIKKSYGKYIAIQWRGLHV